MAGVKKFANGFLDLEKETQEGVDLPKDEGSKDKQVGEENKGDENLVKKNEGNLAIQKVESKSGVAIVEGKAVETTIIKKQKSISEVVAEKLKIAEQRIDLYYNKTTGFGVTIEKPNFSELYAGITMSMNRDLNEIIKYLDENSTFTKTQIIEMLLVEGLKSVKFE